MNPICCTTEHEPNLMQNGHSINDDESNVTEVMLSKSPSKGKNNLCEVVCESPTTTSSNKTSNYLLSTIKSKTLRLKEKLIDLNSQKKQNTGTLFVMALCFLVLSAMSLAASIASSFTEDSNYFPILFMSAAIITLVLAIASGVSSCADKNDVS
ncbi:putative membrane protein [Candidatus Ichthyocystis hellenicum]|uniref:Putative membrane protein n=1 Tax=Candidatus Ichthyocystis hellenicum TaxID=1561003 RepID=A0A0S4M1I7_9BURK|nr:hypothetical protein [Candidatus Ichthyocystis hellenicum]CUT17104.1 putative membrane protein [Candidatus Ichthyocystis hellenicum]